MRLSRELVIAVSFALSTGHPCFAGDPFGLKPLLAELAAYGPAADCQKVSGAAETMICSVPKLRDMDLKLDDQWKKIVDRLDTQAQIAAVAARKDWRSRLRTDCERSLSYQVDECIRLKFEERQAYLTGLAKGNVTVVGKNEGPGASDGPSRSSPKDQTRFPAASNDMAGKVLVLKAVRCSVQTLSEFAPTERCSDYVALVSIIRDGDRFHNLDCKKNGKTYAATLDKSASDGVETLTCRTEGNAVHLLREDFIGYQGAQISSSSLRFVLRSRSSCELTGYSGSNRSIWVDEKLLRVVSEHRLKSATSCRIFDSYEEALGNIQCDAKTKYCGE
jgi:uncharacterized protein